MKKCVSSIFIIAAFLLLNVTNVYAYADGRSQAFNLNYINGSPSSGSYVNSFTLPASNSNIITINVTQLTSGAQLLVSSSGLNTTQSVITEIGTYHIALQQMPSFTSITVNLRLIPNGNLPVTTASGTISY